MVDLEVRGAINVVEASAQTQSIEKIVFTSSLTAAVWRENISSEKDVDERSWSNKEFCRKLKVCLFIILLILIALIVMLFLPPLVCMLGFNTVIFICQFGITCQCSKLNAHQWGC